MTNSSLPIEKLIDVVTKIVSKAHKNGWCSEHPIKDLIDELTLSADAASLFIATIFDHKFAKAFWGEEFTDEEKGPYSSLVMANFPGDDLIELSDPGCVWFRGPRWKYHLQQMVISDNPLKYMLEQGLVEGKHER